jgi:hypothetical protein
MSKCIKWPISPKRGVLINAKYKRKWNDNSENLLPLFLELPSPLLLRAFYPVPSPSGLWYSSFFPCRASNFMGLTSTVPHRSLPPEDCPTSLLFSQCHCNLGFAFAILDTPLTLPHQVSSSRLQEDLESCRGASSPMWLSQFTGLRPMSSPSNVRHV